MRDQARFMSQIKQFLGGFRNYVATIHCVVVHVHTDEFLGETRIRKPTPISDGDTLKIGSVPLVVRMFETPPSTVTSADTERRLPE